MRRRFVTPEGVDLQLELGSAGARAGAFVLDLVIMLVALVAMTIAMVYLFRSGAKAEALSILWLLGAFALRNGWFVLFELGGRGATPGKRVMGLRVIARDGGRLTGSAVVARNTLREVEIFLPLTFLGFQTAEGSADAFLILFALGWSAIFLFFPLFNRDRLRMGDVVAGTWVVREVRQRLAADLVAAAPVRRFDDYALALYGEFELQTLEEVLRSARPDSIATVAWTIRHKAGLPDEGDDLAFLADYYRELCARLERRMSLGNRVTDKWQSTASRR
ncbi:MAG: RDD family protein [Sphingomonas sp.]|nr:MAG: RDD family protein [Sphingomonas sp.]